MTAWDQFISREIERFLTAFQQIEVNVAPPNAAESQIVRVHAPYMMQTITLIDHPERFALLKKRHRDRLRVCYPEPQKSIEEQRPLRRRQHDPTFQEFDEETTCLLGRLIAIHRITPHSHH